MNARKLIASTLVGGVLLGILAGLAVDPEMQPPPEPPWRQLPPDPIYTEPQRVADSGPQDFGPAWAMDRMPTWKRRALARQIAMLEHYPDPVPEPVVPETEPVGQAAVSDMEPAVPPDDAEQADAGETAPAIVLPVKSGA